jgi:hypothetical protein
LEAGVSDAENARRNGQVLTVMIPSEDTCGRDEKCALKFYPLSVRVKCA